MIDVKWVRKDNFKTTRIRVFVSGEGTPDLPVPTPSIKGENKQLDLEWKRYNREEVRLQRELIEEALADQPLTRERLGKLVFSRKAGCSCGCSPGFIAEGFGHEDLFISKSVAAPVPAAPADPNERWLDLA